LSETSDADLVERFREGHAEAFRELFERHWPGVYRVTARLVDDAMEAEDLTQETFLLALASLGSFRGEARFSTWLHRIAVNVSLAWLRKRRRRGERPLEEAPEPTSAADPSAAAADEEMGRALRRAVEDLPPRQRAVFLLRLDGRPFAEIAEMVGRSVGGTKANYHLAVRNLRRKLAPWQQPAAVGRGEP
jgi:RNA polymerase sigma-70 factor (ECF subfamily)